MPDIGRRIAENQKLYETFAAWWLLAALDALGVEVEGALQRKGG